MSKRIALVTAVATCCAAMLIALQTPSCVTVVAEGEGEGEGDDVDRDKLCFEACVNDNDCQIDDVDVGFVCNGEGRCEGAPPSCDTDAECTAEASFWTTECTVNDDCAAVTVGPCIDVGGAGGRCAFAPNAGACAFGELLTLSDVDGAPVDVCGAPETCAGTGECVPPDCTEDADCPGAVCDEGSGDCVQCLDDGDCAGGPLTTCYDEVCGCSEDDECGSPGNAPSVCNLQSGRCDCVVDTECTDSPGGDVCGEDGICGCAAAGNCNAARVFDDTDYVCE